MDTIHERTHVCLLAGKIMLQNGAETYRVEDTMLRMAMAMQIPNPQSYVTPTGIIFSVEGDQPLTRFVRILERSTDLHKIALVNSISRSMGMGELTTREAYRMLEEIERMRQGYPIWLQILAASAASACFLIMFQGTWPDALPAFFTGCFGFTTFLMLQRWVSIRFLTEFLASFVIGLTAVWFVRLGIGYDVDKIIIGSVMPLVPGLLITNAIRDLMAGHLVSGLSKGAEALLTSIAIGGGIASVLAIY